MQITIETDDYLNNEEVRQALINKINEIDSKELIESVITKNIIDKENADGSVCKITIKYKIESAIKDRVNEILSYSFEEFFKFRYNSAHNIESSDRLDQEFIKITHDIIREKYGDDIKKLLDSMVTEDAIKSSIITVFTSFIIDHMYNMISQYHFDNIANIREQIKEFFTRGEYKTLI